MQNATSWRYHWQTWWDNVITQAGMKLGHCIFITENTRGFLLAMGRVCTSSQAGTVTHYAPVQSLAKRVCRVTVTCVGLYMKIIFWEITATSTESYEKDKLKGQTRDQVCSGALAYTFDHGIHGRRSDWGFQRASRGQTLWYILVLFFDCKNSKGLVAAIPLQATEPPIKIRKFLLHYSSKQTQEHFPKNKQKWCKCNFNAGTQRMCVLQPLLLLWWRAEIQIYVGLHSCLRSILPG